MVFAQPGEGRHELGKRSIRRIPVHPRDLGVLGIGVVVAPLRASEFVAVQDHRHPLREQKCREEVALLSGAQAEDGRVIRRALHPGVPGAVLRLPVFALFAVRVIVLLVVRHEVGQGEAVMRGHEVDGCHGASPIALVEVCRTGEARRELAEGGGFTAPEIANGVAILAVPLRPLRREVAHLVAAGAHIPGLGDELHLRDDRVLLHELEEGGELIDVVELPGEG